MLSRKILDGKDKEEVKQLVLAKVKDWVVSNIKRSVKKDLIPLSSILEAVTKIKAAYVDGPSVQDYNNILDIVEE